MNLSIGETVAIDIKTSGLSVTYVAQQMGMSRKGLTDLLKRDDMFLSQVASLSEILGRDYFATYKTTYQSDKGIKLPDILREETSGYVPNVEPEITFTLSIKGAANRITEQIPSLINIIKSETEARGLQLG